MAAGGAASGHSKGHGTGEEMRLPEAMDMEFDMVDIEAPPPPGSRILHLPSRDYFFAHVHGHHTNPREAKGIDISMRGRRYVFSPYALTFWSACPLQARPV